MLIAPKVLIVDDSPDRTEIVGSLKVAGYRVTSAGTFDQATDILAIDPPDVLVTELRLGAFNGLHLIIRSRAHRASTVAIVHTAYPDPVLEAEARRLNADYLQRPVHAPTLLAVIAQRLGRRPERRTAVRRPVRHSTQMTVAGSPAGLIDISDGGFRVELSGDTLRSPLEVRFPRLGISISARVVWAQPPVANRAAYLCGATIIGTNRRSAQDWHRVRESL